MLIVVVLQNLLLVLLVAMGVDLVLWAEETDELDMLHLLDYDWVAVVVVVRGFIGVVGSRKAVGQVQPEGILVERHLNHLELLIVPHLGITGSRVASN